MNPEYEKDGLDGEDDVKEAYAYQVGFVDRRVHNAFERQVLAALAQNGVQHVQRSA